MKEAWMIGDVEEDKYPDRYWGLWERRITPKTYYQPDRDQPTPDLKIYVHPLYISIDYKDTPDRVYRCVSDASKLRLHRVIRNNGYKAFRHCNENKTIFHLEVKR